MAGLTYPPADAHSWIARTLYKRVERHARTCHLLLLVERVEPPRRRNWQPGVIMGAVASPDTVKHRNSLGIIEEDRGNALPADRLVNHLVSDLWELDIVAMAEPACGKLADPWRSDRVKLALQHKRGHITDDRRLKVQRPVSCDPTCAHVPVVGVKAEVRELRMRCDAARMCTTSVNGTSSWQSTAKYFASLK